MTESEFFRAIVSSEQITADMKDYAQNKLDTTVAKAEAQKAKKAKVNAPLLAGIMELLGDGHTHSCASIADYVGISSPKAASLLRGLKAMNKVIDSAGLNSAGRPCKFYALRAE